MSKPSDEMIGQTVVIGCGGSGCNIVSHLQSYSNIPTISINATSSNNVTISLGNKDFIGCRGDSNLGWAIADKHSEEITERIRDYSNVVITACLGGGIGTGAIEVVARCAKSLGIKAIAVIGIPMNFEVERHKKALSQLKEIVDITDRTILFDMNKLEDIGGGPFKLESVLFATDEILCEAMIRINDVLDGPFFSTFTERIYSVSFAASDDMRVASLKAMKSALFAADPNYGKIVISVKNELSEPEKTLIRDTVCGKTGIVPDLITTGEGDVHEIMFFIPISYRSLLS